MFPLKKSFGIVKYVRLLIFLYCEANDEFFNPVFHYRVMVAYYFVMFGSLNAINEGVDGSPPNGIY